MALQNVQQYALHFNITATGAVYTGPGNAAGLVITSHSSGTLKLWDNTAGSGNVLFNTITFNTGEHFIPFYGAKFETGVFATVGGTVDLQFMYNPKNG